MQLHVKSACRGYLSVDTRGRWVFRSSQQQCEHQQPTYDYLCRRWTAQQKTRYNYGRYFTHRLPPCPCFLWQSTWDPRYYLDKAINCAILAFPVSSTTIAQVSWRSNEMSSVQVAIRPCTDSYSNCNLLFMQCAMLAMIWWLIFLRFSELICLYL